MLWMQNINRWISLWSCIGREPDGRIANADVWVYIARLVAALHDPRRAGPNLTRVLELRRGALTPPLQPNRGDQMRPEQGEECVRAFVEVVEAINGDDRLATPVGATSVNRAPTTLVGTTPPICPDLLQRLDRLETGIQTLITRQTVQDWYTTQEFATIVDRTEFTVREWCRLHRINAEKANSGRGSHRSWRISHSELLRYQRDELLPV